MIELKLLEYEDCQAIVAWHENKDGMFLQQWTGHKKYQFPLTVQMIKSRILEEGSMIYKILRDGEMIGTVEVGKFNYSEKSANISRFLIRDQDTNKGFGQEVMEKIKSIGFNEMQLNRLNLNVLGNNEAAIRCYEKAGFVVTESKGVNDLGQETLVMEATHAVMVQ